MNSPASGEYGPRFTSSSEGRFLPLGCNLSGILLYEKRGYKVVEEIEYESKLGNKVPMYKMEKTIHG